MKISEKKLFLLDMDGTIYIADRLFDGTVDFLRTVREKGGKYMFLTNNSSLGDEDYVRRLGKLGIKCDKSDFLTSAYASALYLNKYFPGKKIYASGTSSFVRELKSKGVNAVTELSDDIDCFIMGYDTELTYRKLENACILLNRGIPYIATNPDLTCQSSFGYVPDCGSVAIMLKNATGRVPKYIGKPQPDMLWLATEVAGCRKEDAVMIGDRIYTDIMSGVNAGIDTAFVLSGEGTLEELEKYNFRPTYIEKDIREIYLKLINGD